jgi:hypothetical protein
MSLTFALRVEGAQILSPDPSNGFSSREQILKNFLLAGLAFAAITADAAKAADMSSGGTYVRPVWTWEVGARYWYSSGKNWYNYYADTSTALVVSRLTYEGLHAHSGESFFRVDGPLGLFVKGYVGGGTVAAGKLYDEDLPPALDPYSKTVSGIKGGLFYANADVGITFLDSRNESGGSGTRLGAFVGYHYWNEKVDAYGCSQIGGNTVCVPPIPNSIKGITEQDTWNALRAGGIVDFWFTERVRLTAEAAYARAWQRAVDTHYLTFGRDPANGDGNGFHAEALLNYQMTNAFNVGVGGRWWHYSTKDIDQFNQLLTYTTDRYGVFVQGSLQLR